LINIGNWTSEVPRIGGDVTTRKGNVRPARRRTSETVVRTHVVVITAPAEDGRVASIRPEVDLVKAAILYADSVEVLSLGNQLIRTLDGYASGDSTKLWALTSLIGDNNLRQLDPELDIEQLRQVGTALAKTDASTVRAMAAAEPDGAAAHLARVLDEIDRLGVMDELRVVLERLRLDSGVAELDQARRDKLVSFNERLPIDQDPDTLIAAFNEELKGYLQDPLKFVLLDATIAALASSMIDEGFARPPQRVLSNAGQAVLGTGFLARLPAFPAAPMGELLNLRQDLDEPLSRYRRKVADLRSRLQTSPFDQHIEAEIDAAWRTDIDPALRDIRQSMAEHGLVRELLQALGGDLANFVKGMGPAAGLGVIAANAMDLGMAVSAGLTAGAAAGPSVAKALLARQQGRAAARANDLYYLYETGRRLGR
jgi:hypothetical protein